jgi:hypothetical protein
MPLRAAADEVINDRPKGEMYGVCEEWFSAVCIVADRTDITRPEFCFVLSSRLVLALALNWICFALGTFAEAGGI